MKLTKKSNSIGEKSNHFGFDEAIIVYLLDWFRNNAVWVEVTESDIHMPDEKDRVFFDVARCCRAKLLTGNIKFILLMSWLQHWKNLCLPGADSK